MTRTPLPPRRAAYTTVVLWKCIGGPDHKLIVTCGFDAEHVLREAFCAGFRADTSLCALANDACILLSRLLQHGERIEDLASALIEDRPEGAPSGPPASIIGAIARAGVEIQAKAGRV